MKKYRFKTKEEFIASGRWSEKKYHKNGGYPIRWNPHGDMDKYLGEEIPEKYYEYVEYGFIMDDWAFSKEDIVEFEEQEPSPSELLDKFKQILT